MSDRGRGSSENLLESLATQGAIGEGHERRSSERIEVTWSVDCETEDTFLYASITNISEMGIFVHTTEPLPVARG